MLTPGGSEWSDCRAIEARTLGFEICFAFLIVVVVAECIGSTLADSIHNSSAMRALDVSIIHAHACMEGKPYLRVDR